MQRPASPSFFDLLFRSRSTSVGSSTCRRQTSGEMDGRGVRVRPQTAISHRPVHDITSPDQDQSVPFQPLEGLRLGTHRHPRIQTFRHDGGLIPAKSQGSVLLKCTPQRFGPLKRGSSTCENQVLTKHAELKFLMQPTPRSIPPNKACWIRRLAWRRSLLLPQTSGLSM